ncbi:hypothetical protein JOB18_018785 [Solea senegalensis]|uniref:Uncharacterized protein n=1 Tax=Solea senegalensis TaxID=28829 RepID=A0AAV6Q0G8_SOLSE|nr:hypothetical protein JOB18_018785 [Solea senegalensis]
MGNLKLEDDRFDLKESEVLVYEVKTTGFLDLNGFCISVDDVRKHERHVHGGEGLTMEVMTVSTSVTDTVEGTWQSLPAGFQRNKLAFVCLNWKTSSLPAQ